MKTKINNLIVKYEQYKENIKWHIKTNSDTIKPTELPHLQQRVIDYQEVINDLKEIAKI